MPINSHLTPLGVQMISLPGRMPGTVGQCVQRVRYLYKNTGGQPSKSWLLQHGIWCKWFHREPVSRIDRFRISLIRIIWSVKDFVSISFDWDMVEQFYHLAYFVLRKLGTKPVPRTQSKSPPKEKTVPRNVRRLNAFNDFKKSQKATGKLRRSHAVRRGGGEGSSYVPPHQRRKVVGEPCPVCQGPVTRGFLSNRTFPYTQEELRTRWTTPYARCWREASSGYFTGEELRTKYGDLATAHRCRLADKNYNSSHPFLCYCVTGKPLSMRKGPKLSLSFK